MASAMCFGGSICRRRVFFTVVLRRVPLFHVTAWRQPLSARCATPRYRCQRLSLMWQQDFGTGNIGADCGGRFEVHPTSFSLVHEPPDLAGIRLEPCVLSVPLGVPAMRDRSASKTLPGLLMLSFATLVLAQPAAALDADYWLGGWRTPLGQEPRIYEFVIRGPRVTGVYCRSCSDASTIGFIDGTWNEKSGIDFRVT